MLLEFVIFVFLFSVCVCFLFVFVMVFFGFFLLFFCGWFVLVFLVSFVWFGWGLGRIGVSVIFVLFGEKLEVLVCCIYEIWVFVDILVGLWGGW